MSVDLIGATPLVPVDPDMFSFTRSYLNRNYIPDGNKVFVERSTSAGKDMARFYRATTDRLQALHKERGVMLMGVLVTRWTAQPGEHFGFGEQVSNWHADLPLLGYNDVMTSDTQGTESLKEGVLDLPGIPEQATVVEALPIINSTPDSQLPITQAPDGLNVLYPLGVVHRAPVNKLPEPVSRVHALASYLII